MAPPYPFPDPLPPVPPRMVQPPKRVQEVRDYRERFNDAMQVVPGLPPVPTGPYDPPTDPRYLDALLNLQHGVQQGGHLLDAAGNYPSLGGLYPPVAGAAGTIDPVEIDRLYGSNPGATIANAIGDLGAEFWRGVGDSPLGQGIYEDALVASGHIPPPPLTATPEAVPLPNPYPGMNPPYTPQPPPYQPPPPTPPYQPPWYQPPGPPQPTFPPQGKVSFPGFPRWPSPPTPY